VQTIERGGLLIIPRVTNMQNGFFRPEVVYSNGKHSDIVFGDLHLSRVRCASIAEHAALAAAMMSKNMGGAWDECARGLANCKRMAEILLGSL
jgi:hypothetical protein